MPVNAAGIFVFMKIIKKERTMHGSANYAYTGSRA
jgi:hypothetical protein